MAARYLYSLRRHPTDYYKKGHDALVWQLEVDFRIHRRTAEYEINLA
jgi:hypothetical protein